MIVMKKNTLIIGITVIFAALGGSLVYLIHSNTKLQAALIENENQADKRLQALEEKLNPPSGTTSSPEEHQGTNPIRDQYGTNSNPIRDPSDPNPESQFMSEDELLKNYFAESPSLIMPGGGENPNPENVDASGPVLTSLPEILDLGQISKANGTVEARFELKNTGGSDLVIYYALSSCGCTVTPIKEAHTLKPNESLELPVTYDPNFYGPDYELGTIEKTVTIFSNYPAQPFYKVKFKANVIP